jgi:large subunit ribosomal protein L16
VSEREENTPAIDAGAADAAPAETRMGSGKGSPEWWIANVKPGRIVFEMSYPNEATAREALRRAIHKLPMKCRIVTRDGVVG